MTTRRFFGTDGIRGVAGELPLTPGFVMRLGRALARSRPGTAVLGRDTRQSSPALRDALSAGLLADGATVVDVGVLPTPAIAGEVLRRGAASGIVITASHNPFGDNGIKVFGPDGTKLDDDEEEALEIGLQELDPDDPGAPGRWTEEHEEARTAYLASLAPAERCGEGLRLAVDAANGAASAVAAEALSATGADVQAIACTPDGRNINRACGALHPGRLVDLVSAGVVDLGIALDGDADRCVIVGEDGELIDGDVLIALLAMHRGLDQVIGTVMTNEGVVRHLAANGVVVHRAAVGDRNVLAMMKERGAVLGGESSGHVIQLDRGPTGDGLATALAALQLRHDRGERLCEQSARVPRYPSRLRAVAVASKPPLHEVSGLSDAVADAERRLAGQGRILIRYSGTEPVLRVFVEGADSDLVRALCDELSETARSTMGVEEE